MRAAVGLVLLLACPAAAAAQTTRAEGTGYRETSSHADVLGFLDSLRALGAPIEVDTLALSPRGRLVPYVVASRPLVTDPAQARSGDTPVVYRQANIHAGEVRGTAPPRSRDGGPPRHPPLWSPGGSWRTRTSRSGSWPATCWSPSPRMGW